MRDFLYFEPLSDGHCAYWASTLLTSALEDCRVRNIKLIASRSLLDRLGNLDPRVAVSALAPEELVPMLEGDLFSRGRAQWAALRRNLKSNQTCFLPFFDHAILHSVIDRRPIAGRVGGVIFRAPNMFGRRPNGRELSYALSKWITYYAARRPTLAPLMTLDQCTARSTLGRFCGLHYVPDPAPVLDEIKGKVEVTRSDCRRVFLLFGALTKRKGVFSLLESLVHIPASTQRKIALRFVGRVADEDRIGFYRAIRLARERAPDILIEVTDAFVSDDVLSQEVVNAFTIIAPYQNHVGSSGVLLWAAAAGVPIICQSTGLMGYEAKTYGLGKLVNSNDPVELAEAIRSSAEGPATRILGEAYLGGRSALLFSKAVFDNLFDER